MANTTLPERPRVVNDLVSMLEHLFNGVGAPFMSRVHAYVAKLLRKNAPLTVRGS